MDRLVHGRVRLLQKVRVRGGRAAGAGALEGAGAAVLRGEERADHALRFLVAASTFVSGLVRGEMQLRSV